MIITITATLNDEQVYMLATQKGYQDTIIAISEDPESNKTIEVPNPQSRSDFIRQVYEGMIIGDATRESIAFSNKMKEAERIAEENAIRQAVESSITSSIS